MKKETKKSSSKKSVVSSKTNIDVKEAKTEKVVVPSTPEIKKVVIEDKKVSEERSKLSKILLIASSAVLFVGILLLVIGALVDNSTVLNIIGYVISMIAVLGFGVRKIISKTEKKIGSIVNFAFLYVALILFIIGFFVETNVGLYTFGLVALTISLVGYSIASKNYPVVKAVLSVVLAGCIGTWLIPYGYYQDGVFSEYMMSRIGLTDIPSLFSYALYFAMDKIIYLLALAGFYGVLSSTKGYQALVNKIAKAMEKQKVVFSLIIMLVMIIFTSLFTQTLVVLAFIPFFISILSKMKVDKVTTMLVTFGGLFVGMIGTPYGTEGLYWWNYYVGSEITDGLSYRLIVAAVAIVVFALFVIIRLIKVRNNNELEAVEDKFEIAEGESKAKIATPVFILVILLAIAILGYVDWSGNFGIETFTSLHDTLTEYEAKILLKGETTISYVLGSNAKEFGSWTLISMTSTFAILSILIAFINRIKFTDFMSRVDNGIKKFAKPICFYVITFIAFIVVYMNPYTVTITNWFASLTTDFSAITTALNALFISVLHVDLGYTGYAVGSYLTSLDTSIYALASTIYVAMYGLAQVILPTSALLLFGLSYTDLKYKDYLKYIWKIALALFVALVATFVIISLTIA